MWATIIIESRSRELWVRQLVMSLCTVPSSDRRRRFLQYNFMDPGWGGGQNFLRGANPPAGAGAAFTNVLVNKNVEETLQSFDCIA